MKLHRPLSIVRLRGLTLVELMVSLALGLLVVLAATGLLLSTRTGYLTQDDQAQLLDGARYALEVIGRAVRQAGYENWDTEGAPILRTASMSPNVLGLDAHRLKAGTAALVGASNAADEVVNGSDVLAVRFFGSGAAPDGDGTVLDCAGLPVPAPTSQDAADDERGWSIFYVAQSTAGEPALYCKYRGWSAQPIVLGVESFQVLYGVDQDDDGSPDRYMRAGDLADKSFWDNVVVVRVGLLMRGGHADTRADAAHQVYDLFGPDYSDAHAALDPGVHISENDLPAAQRKRLRAVFGATFQLRNRAGGGG